MLGGRFRVLSHLAGGGMAGVDLAGQGSLRRRVAPAGAGRKVVSPFLFRIHAGGLKVIVPAPGASP